MRSILLIIADDLGRNVGCYGDPVVKTPHLDALAVGGVRFDSAYASTASCSGSRSVIYTGLHTHQTGQYGLQHSFHHFMTHDHVETLPLLFNRAGYLTGIINKIHVGPDHVYPWTVRDESPTRDVKWVADRAGAFFARAKDEGKPFHLTIGFMDPHRDNSRGGFSNGPAYPSVTDVKYNPNDMPVPDYLNDLPEVRQELAEYYQSISRMDQGVGLVLAELARAGFEDDTMVMFVSDNGAPFLNSKTTLYDTGVRLPVILRTPGGPRGVVNPALVSYIDIVPTFLDFAGVNPKPNPDANLPPPARQGRSILPILGAASVPPGWGEIYGSHTFHELTNYYPTRFLRSERFKYHRNICWKLDFPFSADIFASKSWQAIRNAPPAKGAPGLWKDSNSPQREIIIGHRALSAYLQRGPEELYDMHADPHEVINLAQKPEYAAVLKEMRDKLEQWQRETEDPWLFRDGVSVRSMQQYIGEDGWQLQDRFDFDLLEPAEK